MAHDGGMARASATTIVMPTKVGIHDFAADSTVI
jgi:hypothetical protein